MKRRDATPEAASAGEPGPRPQSIDRHVAEVLRRLCRHGDAGLLSRTVLLLSALRSEGHSCMDLRDHAGTAPPGEAAFPALAPWRQALLETGLCVAVPDAQDAGEPRTPLVLDRRDRLYLLRWFLAERRVAAALRARMAEPPQPRPADLRAALARLFPDLAAPEPDWQAAAALAAVRSRLCVVTGGPGSGKTHTVARLLALLLSLDAGLSCALAAPTGKAAARLGEALDAQLPALLGHEQRARIGAPRTLHRLLGYLPDAEAFRFGPDRRLPFDVVVLDEASMVDLSLADALLQALRDDARLVLLGDRDQLASIAPGQVLGDLCRAAAPERGAGPRLAAAYRALGGADLPGQTGALADHVVMLHRNYRFGAQPGLGGFARALAERMPQAALAAMQAGHDDLRWLGPLDPAHALEPAAGRLRALAAAATAQDALDLLQRFRVLCATQRGPFGVEACNRRLQAMAAAAGLRVDGPFYRGRPVLVTQNDPFTRLYNGDLGVCWPDDQGRPAVWFPSRDGLRPMAPLRMPPCESAFAMTVHKAQGSEFDEVLLLLPDRDGPLCHAGLLYTAVTRSRTRASVAGPEAVLRAALGRFPERTSGLCDALLAGA